MKLAWIDIETSGIDPRAPNAKVFEVAVVVTGDSFQVLGQRQYVIRCKELLEDQMTLDKYVFDMHTTSGLFDDMKAGSVNQDRVDDLLSAFLDKFLDPTVKNDKLIPAGRNVAAFDVAWLKVHLPKTAAKLHYRSFDVTTLMLLSEMAGRPTEKLATAHRAMTDILQDITLADNFVHKLMV